jgi:hypothetical protein
VTKHGEAVVERPMDISRYAALLFGSGRRPGAAALGGDGESGGVGSEMW